MNNRNLLNSTEFSAVTMLKGVKSRRLYFGNTDSSPLLKLPDDFGISFKESRKEPAGKKPIYLPEVDKLLNEYKDEVLPILFTINFIELVNQNFYMLDFSLKNDKLSFAVNLYFKMANLPVFANDDEIRKTISFYFNSSIFDFGKNESAKLNELKNSLEPIRKIYLEKLKKVEYKREKETVILGKESANWFMDFADNGINNFVFEYFIVKKAIILQNLPDSIINDPRFRPSLTDPRWNEYDGTIKEQVASYNQKFAKTPEFKLLDWRYVKAMVWTEVLAGPKGDPIQWSKYPLQIGRFSADAGYSVVKSGGENSDLITTSELRTQIQSDVTGKNNIKAGIAYLYTIAIRGKVSYREVVENPLVLTYTIEKGDTIDKLVKKLGTTRENIIKNSKLNEADIGKLSQGQIISYQKSHSERFIAGWRDWKTAIKDYNGGGDPDYMNKLDKAYQIITSREN